MVRLLRIELQDFKSYAGFTTIPFRAFTAIIGPNGAGKSNLMDAISFALGVRTANLRGTQLRDLIHRPPGSGSAEPRRGAFVTAVIEDNTGAELEFTRTITTAGNSEYKLNGRVVSFADYEKTLRELNILVKARNFLVFQGDVESIAAKSPQDLTSLLEQISGSEELKAKYEELAKAKERAEENTIFHFQKRKGAAAEKKQLRLQTDEAERFKSLQEARDALQLEQVLWELFNFSRDLAKHKKEIEADRKESKELEQRRATAERKISEKKQMQATAHKEVLSLDKQLAKLSQEDAQLRPTQIKHQEELSHLQRRITTYASSISNFQTSYDRAKQTLAGLQQDHDSVSAQIEHLERQQKAERTDIKLVGSQVAEYNQKKEEVMTRTASLQRELDAEARIHKTGTDALASLEVQAQELATHVAELDVSSAEARRRQQALSNLLGTATKDLRELEVKHSQVIETRNSNSRKQQSLKELLSKAEESLREAKVDMREMEREKKFGEMLDRLKRAHKGVHGRLFDLCRPSKARYNVAVTVVMGKNMDAIVVDTEVTALDCIQYMKSHQLGTATFIPLDTIRVKSLNERLRRLGGTAKLVVDVIDHDPVLLKALLYACGNTLVCDDLREARQLGHSDQERYKVVTLDGTLIDKSGLMTGGLGGVESKSQRWDNKKMEVIRRNRDQYVRELSELSSLRNLDAEAQNLLANIETKRDLLKMLQSDMDRAKQILKSDEEQRAISTSKITALTPQIDALKKTIEISDDKIKELRRKIYRIEDEIFRTFCAEVGVQNIREYDERASAGEKDRAQRKRALFDQKSKLVAQIEHHTKHHLQSAQKQLEAAKLALKKDQEQAEVIRRQAESLSEKEKSVRERKEMLEKSQKEAKRQYDELELEIKELRRDIAEKSKEIQSLQQTLTSKEAAVDQLRSSRRTLLQRCKVDEIPVPLRTGGTVIDVELEADDTGPSQGDTQRSTMRSSQNERDDQLQIDFSKLDSKMTRTTNAAEIAEISGSFESRIQMISAELDKLAPNMRANEHLDEVKDRLKVLMDDFEEAKRQAKDISEQFQAVKQERTDRFMRAFTQISTRIDPIYKELTRSAAVPGGGAGPTVGGEAYLSLESTDEPFLHGIKYTAMPPLKRFRDMDQLSGGEKTVAALALLFAIHEFQPAPFFVLDEIDAALDMKNVIRVAQHIQARSASVQFIVISLKDTFYEKADSLVGVCRDQANDCSRILTLDLTPYQD
eukprot:TRINITY_DN3847_c0_g1_i1.p1 TRINITY_DN3847_c0_g1~~TRINITY_DN3847_c0_g1_i1.p1  ORF type:complete len:1241 (+),score=315.68 TRINITY_DN3847_c0_g1_i1:25-3723(+)